MQSRPNQDLIKQELFLPIGIKICQVNSLDLCQQIIPKTFVTYQNQDTSIASLVQQYIDANSIHNKIKKQKLIFYINDRRDDLMHKTISQIKIILNNQTVQTLLLTPYLVKEEANIVNECNFDNYRKYCEEQRQQNHRDNCLQFCIKIPKLGSEAVIYELLNCRYQIQHQIIKSLKKNQKICKGNQLWKYSMRIKSLINDQIIQPNQQVITLKQHNVIELNFLKSQSSFLQEYKSDNNKIKVISAKKKIVAIFSYKQIQNLRVYSVLQLCKIKNPLFNGLRIFSKTIKPFETMSTYNLSKYFVQNKEIEAYIIPEMDNFYDFEAESVNSNITINQKQDLLYMMSQKIYDEIKKSAVQENEAKYNNILQRKKDIIKNIRIDAYKQPQFYDPIFCYSSQYFSRKISEYFRNSNFYFIDQKSKSQSKQYRFIRSLVNSLQKLPNYDGKVYRGMTAKDNFSNVGEIVCYKSFTTTSIKQTKAFEFGTGTMYQIQCLSGKNINQFSYYPNQYEILLLPYTYYKVLSVDRSQSTYKIHLRQISSVRKKSENVLLWVDDNTKEGSQIYGNLLSSYPMMKTQLQQILNNQDLAIWLEKFEYCFNSLQPKNKEMPIKLSVITDMKRGKNLSAGVQTIKLIRQYFGETTDIFVFVGDKRGAESVFLKNNLMQSNNLIIGNKIEEVKTFIRERVLKPEQLLKPENACQLI